jgi:hypothetical protein
VVGFIDSSAKGNGNISVAPSCGLRSGLRQSGGRFAAAFFGTRERVPFRFGGGLKVWGA